MFGQADVAQVFSLYCSEDALDIGSGIKLLLEM